MERIVPGLPDKVGDPGARLRTCIEARGCHSSVAVEVSGRTCTSLRHQLARESIGDAESCDAALACATSILGLWAAYDVVSYSPRHAINARLTDSEPETPRVIEPAQAVTLRPI